jgi:3-oxoacyl-[acyl-carrier protein] reductase
MPIIPDISGKVALVTGASRGIGRAIAQRLASAGAIVVITARSVEKEAGATRRGAQKTVAGTLAETVELIERAGGKAIPIGADLENPQERDSLIERAAAAAGALDILINNAGFCDFVAVAQMPLSVFDRTLEHYIRIPFVLAKGAIPLMRKRGGGWIVNITSSQALPVTRPFPDYLAVSGDAVYSAAKAAINRLTQGLAAELFSANIAVNAVGPSTAIMTPGAADYIPGSYPTEDVAYLAESVLAMCHLPAADRTGLIAYSMHFPWHHGIEVRSLDGRNVLPRLAPPAWSNPAINPSGE